MATTFVNHDFLADINNGFSLPTKRITSPKYFYDDYGSKLFNQITRLPSYYLTACEIQILDQHRSEIIARLNCNDINIIELGPGEGVKTAQLLAGIAAMDVQCRYLPIDVSLDYLQKLADRFAQQLPKVSYHPIQDDYLHGIQVEAKRSSRRNLVLFLGSSIGNFNVEERHHFLNQLHDALNPGDFVLIGFDLIKHPRLLLDAYNDVAGITSAFNLNLLTRINNELGGDFDLNSFYHFSSYNVLDSVVESYLISHKQQSVHIRELNKSFFFDTHEAIHTEFSFKFSLDMVERLAKEHGFAIAVHYFDEKQYFLDSLWQVL